MNTKKFEAAFLELVEEDMESALQLITGMFVGLTLEYTRRRGEDASKTLRINGCGNRDITIHEFPNVELTRLAVGQSGGAKRNES